MPPGPPPRSVAIQRSLSNEWSDGFSLSVDGVCWSLVRQHHNLHTLYTVAQIKITIIDLNMTLINVIAFQDDAKHGRASKRREGEAVIHDQ